jgi:hypothetical protein
MAKYNNEKIIEDDSTVQLCKVPGWNRQSKPTRKI